MYAIVLLDGHVDAGGIALLRSEINHLVIDCIDMQVH